MVNTGKSEFKQIQSKMIHQAGNEVSILPGQDEECDIILKGKSCKCDAYWLANEGACSSCKTLTKLRCNGCYIKPFFCSKECQIKEWEAGHKSVCGFWKEIKKDGQTFYKAKKEIPAGTKLFRKAPLYVQPDKIEGREWNDCPFPMDYYGRNIKMEPFATCLSCAGWCAPMEPITTPTNVRFRRCPVCKWPVCNTAKCAEKHKEFPECLILKNSNFTWEKALVKIGVKLDPYGLIGAIRAVSLKKNKPYKWQQFLKLETFAIQQQPKHTEYGDQLFTCLRESLKVNWISRSEWNTYLYIMSQNRFRSNHRLTWDRRFATIVYEGPRGYIMPHCCSPNTYINVNKLNFIGTVVAHVTIPKGYLLGANLDPEFPSVMKPLYGRNNFLSINAYQICGTSGIKCHWCLNPRTEGGAMFSAIKCKQCGTGYLMPNVVMANKWIYTCSTDGCENLSDNERIEALEYPYFREFRALKGEFGQSLKWVAEVEKKTFHPLHYLCTAAKFTLARSASRLIKLSRINSLGHLRKAKDMYLPVFQYMGNWMNAFTPGRLYYKADFMFFETLLTLGSYAIDLNEKTKSLQEVEELIGELIEKLEWCMEIFDEDPMQNLMDDNGRLKVQTKIVLQFFVEAEKIYQGEFKPKADSDVAEGPMVCEVAMESEADKNLEANGGENLEANGGGGGGDGESQEEFKNLRRLAVLKIPKIAGKFSFFGDHLAPPSDAEFVESSFYTVGYTGGQEMNFLD